MFVAEALAIEAQGGLMLPDGSRRRTLGGVFFHLLRKGVTPAERRVIFPAQPSSRSPAALREPVSAGRTMPRRCTSYDDPGRRRA